MSRLITLAEHEAIEARGVNAGAVPLRIGVTPKSDGIDAATLGQLDVVSQRASRVLASGFFFAGNFTFQNLVGCTAEVDPGTPFVEHIIVHLDEPIEAERSIVYIEPVDAISRIVQWYVERPDISTVNILMMEIGVQATPLQLTIDDTSNISFKFSVVKLS